MKFAVAYHTYWDARIDKLFESIMPIAEKYFENKSYSNEVNSLLMGIRCTRLPSEVKRGKFSRKLKELEFQVTIDYNYYMSLKTLEEQKECIAVCILRDTLLLVTCKPKQFSYYELREGFKNLFQNIGWLGESFTMI